MKLPYSSKVECREQRDNKREKNEKEICINKALKLVDLTPEKNCMPD